MSPGKRFNDYIESVLRGVSFKEAHSEIRKELTNHLEEAKEITSGLNLSEEEIETQVIRRMGDATNLGSTLDQVHRPRVDYLVLGMLAFLLAVGSFAMFQLDRIGLHLLWLGLGVIPLVALMLIKPTSVRERSWSIYGATVALGILASAIGPWYEGQPYLSLGPIHIKLVDLSVALFVLALAGPIADTNGARITQRSLLFLATLIPLAAYAWIGSFFPALLLGSSCLAMMITSRQPKEMVVGYSATGAALVGASLSGSAFISGEKFSEVAAKERHTDFVFNFLTSTTPALAMITAATSIALTTYLISVSRSVKNPYGKTVSAGAIALITAGILWGTLSNLGFMPMPMTGVYFPFLSYSGSLMIAHMALIGIVLGVQRRRNLHFS